MFINNNLTAQKLIDNLFKKGEIFFEYYNFSNEEENQLTEFLEVCLKEIGKENIFNFLRFCFKELLGNAKKANIKRLYFLDKKLNIENPSDYKKGMEHFKTDLHEYPDKYLNRLEKNKLYIKVILKVEDDNFFIIVKNNSVIHNDELKIAEDKIKHAKKFNSIEEAFLIVQQNKEGAGLGIIIIILMLKELGLSSDNFSITKNNDETEVLIKIPLSLITPKQKELVNEIILKEIENLPAFPEYIADLQKKTDDPGTPINEILKPIIKNSSLAAEILKSVNSIEFMPAKKITKIKDAITFLGYKRLKNILYLIGVKKIFNERFNISEIRDIWNYSYKVALFSFLIAKKFNKADLEEIYINGILHDIGRILLSGINPELMVKITDLCQQKSIPLRILEELTHGYNHSFIGCKIAEKWNFPSNMLNIIKHHHNPGEAPQESKVIVNCIYLADIIAKSDNLYETYDQMDKSILNYFKLKDFKNFVELALFLNKKFESDNFKNY